MATETVCCDARARDDKKEKKKGKKHKSNVQGEATAQNVKLLSAYVKYASNSKALHLQDKYSQKI